MKTKRTLQPWSLEALIAREKTFDGLIEKAVKMTLRPLAMNIDGLLTASVAAELSLSTLASSMLGPTVSMDSAGAISLSWEKFVGNELLPFLHDTFMDGATQAHAGLPADTPVVADFIAQDYLATAANKLRDISDLVWMSIQAELQEGVNAGEDMRQLATRVRAASEMTAARAMTIARTEVHRAAEAGSLAQVRLSGFTNFECKKRWLATEDERTRLAHIQADGQTVGLNEVFWVADEGLQFPGDPMGRASNTINCRCTMEYLLDDDEDELTASGAPSQVIHTFHLPGQHDQRTHGRDHSLKSKAKKVVSTVTSARSVVSGKDALAAVPVDLDKISGDAPNYQALKAYRTQGFRQVNDMLRGEGMFANDPIVVKIYKPQTDAWINAVDDTMKDSKLDKDIEVFRGLQVAESTLGPRDSWPESFVGKTWTDKGFVSTTTDRSVAAGFAEGGGVMLRVRAPKGSGAIRMSGGEYESEILLDRNQKFRVVGDSTMDEDGKKVRVLDVEIDDSLQAAVWTEVEERLHPRDTHGRFRHGDAHGPVIKDIAEKVSVAAEPQVSLKDLLPLVDENTVTPPKIPKELIKQLKDIFTGQFGGFSTKVNNIEWAFGRHRLRVGGAIHDAKGREVGYFNRIFKINNAKEFMVENESLYLDRDVQGQGFAQAFNKQSFSHYRNMGIKKVQLQADIDVGGYAWAREGYDWAPDDAPSLSEMSDRIKDGRVAQMVEPPPRTQKQIDDVHFPIAHNLYKIPAERREEQAALIQKLWFDIGNTVSLDTMDDEMEDIIEMWPTPFELSQLGRWPGAGKDDWWVGKAIMAGSNWIGVKYLDDLVGA